jgi:DNA-binding NtrC family response regulator
MANILLIDDEPDLLSAMAEVLAAEGHQVTALSNGLALFGAEFEIDFDLVVTDIIMPGVDGLEIVAHLQRQKPGLNVVAISGGGRIEPSFHLRLAQQMGASETLQKPFQLKSLTETVDRVLRDKETGDGAENRPRATADGERSGPQIQPNTAESPISG